MQCLPFLSVARSPACTLHPALSAVQAASGSAVWEGLESGRGDGRPDLATSDIVFVGGRGISDKEGLDALQRAADRWGGAVGCSRVLVDEGLVRNEYQVRRERCSRASG